MKQSLGGEEEFWQRCTGKTIANQYYLEQLLGCGAYGGVFRAIQIVAGKKQQKRVAVKLMRSGKMQSQEIQFAINLQSHQNLVQHFTGNNVEIGDFPMFYLAMELGDISLYDFLKDRSKLMSLEAKSIVQGIAQGLQFLHEIDSGNSQDKKCVHRDLKSLNVLKFGDTWKIADFGLAKALDMDTMQASQIAGTLYYMPPELFQKGYVSTKWDIWSLGIMIVEMLTGHYPFDAERWETDEQVRQDIENAIKNKNPNLQGLPSEWVDIVKGCLNKNYSRRWTASKLLIEIGKIGLPVSKTDLGKKAIKSQSHKQVTSPKFSLQSNEKTVIMQNEVKVRKSTSKIGESYNTHNAFIGVLTFIILIFTGVMNRHLLYLMEADRLFYKTEDKIGAVIKYNEVISIKPDDQYSYLQLASLKTQLGDKQGALSDYSEAIRLKPNDKDTSEIYVERASLKGELGDKQGAISDYNEAIRLKPDYASVYTFRASDKRSLGDNQGALSDYNEAIRLKPDDKYFYSNRAHLKKELGDKQGALSDYNEIIRIEPQFSENYVNRAHLKEELGDKQGALSDYNYAIDRYSFHEGYYLNRASLKEKLGDSQGALSDYNKAIELKPDNAYVYYKRGSLKSDSGDQQGAISDYNEVIRLKPNNSYPYYALGNSYKALGDKTKALENFRKAAAMLKQQNDTEWYRKALNEIAQLER